MRPLNTNRDRIYLPAGNGYSSIPARGLRAWDSERQEPAVSALSLLSMKIKNNLQFGFMIAGMAGMTAYIGYTISGMLGVIMAFIVAVLGFAVTSNFSISQVLRHRSIRLIHPSEGGVLYQMLKILVERAGLDKFPVLFLEDSPEINAFTVEDKERAVIVLSRGIINNLTKQELNGVLAHEIAHLKNNDVRIMLFSDQMRKLTGYMALFGQILLVLNLPFLLLNQVMIPWTTIVLLIAAPSVSFLFQVALSRNREFKADMDAVLLTGETVGLARALKKINMQTAFWKRIYAPYLQKVPEILRTHPNTQTRIQKLEELSGSQERLVWSD